MRLRKSAEIANLFRKFDKHECVVLCLRNAINELFNLSLYKNIAESNGCSASGFDS